MEQQPVTDNDEISLIELFIVLLKHRWLIFLPVMTILVLFAALYIFYPQYKTSKTPNETYYEAGITVSVSPLVLSLRKENTMLDLLNSFFRDPSVIYETLLATDYDAKENLGIELYADKEKAISEVKQSFIENKSLPGRKLDKAYRLYTVQIANNQISLKFADKNPKAARLFLAGIAKIASVKVKDYLQDPAKEYVLLYGPFIAEIRRDTVLEASLSDSLNKFIVASSILDNSIEPIIIVENPGTDLNTGTSLSQIRKSMAKKGIILIFAIFFLSVLAAFILNAIENIKKDPATMEKIREALGKNKA